MPELHTAPALSRFAVFSYHLPKNALYFYNYIHNLTFLESDLITLIELKWGKLVKNRKQRHQDGVTKKGRIPKEIYEIGEKVHITR